MNSTPKLKLEILTPNLQQTLMCTTFALVYTNLNKLLIQMHRVQDCHKLLKEKTMQIGRK